MSLEAGSEAIRSRAPFGGSFSVMGNASKRTSVVASRIARIFSRLGGFPSVMLMINPQHAVDSFFQAHLV